jgi:hypothetical protein
MFHNLSYMNWLFYFIPFTVGNAHLCRIKLRNFDCDKQYI